MTHQLYHELSLIAATEQGRAAVQIAATAQGQYGLLPEIREKLRRSMRSQFYPQTPENMIFHRDCFWAKFEVKGIWHKAWEGTGGQKDAAAEWLRMKREEAIRRGKAWPPAPMFQRAYTLPQPQDGKDGATGWTPRNGKSEINIFKKKIQ